MVVMPDRTPRCFEVQPAEESTRQPVNPLDHCSFVTAPGRPRDGSHQCYRDAGHMGPHTCECHDIWERGEALTGYQCPTYYASEPVVIGDIPDVMLMSLEFLQQRHSRGFTVVNGNEILMGRHEDGGIVNYLVHGWDHRQQGLVLTFNRGFYEYTRGLKS